MLEKTIERIRRLAPTPMTANPLQFNDPLAAQVEWGPLKGGGTNIRTHKLVADGLQQMRFVATVGAWIFYTIFLLVGLGLMIAMSISSTSFKIETMVAILIGLVFALIGGGLLYFGTRPIVFDKQSGFFWKGYKAPDQVFDKRALKHCTELANIHALQIVSESCRSKNGSYYSYELNLVLKDGTRMNVVDHGNLKKLREDTAALAQFLGNPVWDSTRLNPEQFGN